MNTDNGFVQHDESYGEVSQLNPTLLAMLAELEGIRGVVVSGRSERDGILTVQVAHQGLAAALICNSDAPSVATNGRGKNVTARTLSPTKDMGIGSKETTPTSAPPTSSRGSQGVARGAIIAGTCRQRSP